jgi:hypothetical protein
MASDSFIDALSMTLDELLACCELLAGDAQGLARSASLVQSLEVRRNNLKHQLTELGAAVTLSQQNSGFALDVNAAFSQLEPLLQEFGLVVAAYENVRRNAEAEASAPDGIARVSQKTRRTYFQMKAASAALPGRVA